MHCLQVLDGGGAPYVEEVLANAAVTSAATLPSAEVSPAAVECVLAEHPLVLDVGVVGQPDDEWGERVVACVVPRSRLERPTLGDLRRFAAGRLTAAELPRQLRYVESVPRSSGGKVLRRELRSGRGPV